MRPIKNSLGSSNGNIIERLEIVIAQWALIIMALLVGLNVFSRLLSFEIVPDTVLLIRELMVCVIVLPLAFLAAQREHISVTIFTEKVGARGKLALSLLSSLAGLIFSIFVLSAGWRLFAESLSSSEYYYGTLHIPQWPGHLLFFIGFLLLALRLFALFLGDIKALLLKEK